MGRVVVENMSSPYWLIDFGSKKIDLTSITPETPWAMTSIEIVEEKGKPHTGKITFEDPRYFLTDSSLIRTGGAIQVSLGYVQEFVTYNMFIKSISNDYPETKSPTLSLILRDGSFAYAKNKIQKAFPKQSLKDRVLAILSSGGSPAVWTEQTIDWIPTKAADIVVEADVCRTDLWSFLQTILYECGCSSYNTKNRLEILQNKTDLVPGFDTWGEYDLYYQCGDGSLLSFKVDEEDAQGGKKLGATTKKEKTIVVKSGGPGGVDAVLPDRSEGEPEATITHDPTTRNASLGTKGVETSPAKATTGAKPSDSPSTAAARASRARSQIKGVSMELLYASSLFRLGIPVSVWGCAKRHEGVYHPNKLTRKVELGKVSLTLSVEKSGGGRGAGKAKPKTPPNTGKGAEVTAVLPVNPAEQSVEVDPSTQNVALAPSSPVPPIPQAAQTPPDTSGSEVGADGQIL